MRALAGGDRRPEMIFADDTSVCVHHSRLQRTDNWVRRMPVKNKPATAQTLVSVTSLPEKRLYGKISRHLLPLLFVSYLFAFLDRINVSYAQLQMKPFLGFSDAVYGLGAGIFFISYVLFELPGTLWMARSGIRRTLLPIMLLWGLVSAGTMFIRLPIHFYIARFFLGMLEAGFFPGVILYLTYWFPARKRGRVTTLFMLAIPVAGAIGSPLSSLIISSLDLKAHLFGWQWLFLLEGLPASALGIICFLSLPDCPTKAVWINDEERIFLLADGIADVGGSTNHFGESTWIDRVRRGCDLVWSRQLWGLAFVYFTISCANYTFAFWLPTILKSAGVESITRIGWLSAIPFGFGTIGALLIAKSSDLRGERRWHIALAIALAAVALESSTIFHGSVLLTVSLLTCGAFFHFGGGILFWTVPPACLQGDRGPAGIAMVSSIGVIGGFVSPITLGWMKAQTGRLDIGVSMICILMIFGSLALLRTVPRA